MTDELVVNEPGTDLEVRAPEAVNLFRTEDPDEVIRRATATADALAKVVRDKNLATNIKGREHVRVEGWTLLGTMLGVFPVCVETRKLEDGWLARVEARTLSGAVVGAAEAECLRSENTWAKRDDYALLSMAQTRATSKALRQPLGFVMTLAGFEATPSDEMPTQDNSAADSTPPAKEDAPTQAQWNRMTGILEELKVLTPPPDDGPTSWDTVALDWARARFGKTPEALTKDEVHQILEEFEDRLEDARLPFKGGNEKAGTA